MQISYLTEPPLNNHTKLTELKEGEDTPTPLPILLDRIQLNHLLPQQQIKARESFRLYGEVLTSHEWDIPVNRLNVVGDIQLKDSFNDNGIANTKLIPIPARAKEKVQKTLDNMEKRGVIERLYTYSPFIQNLLLGKRNLGNLGFYWIRDRQIIGLKNYLRNLLLLKKYVIISRKLNIPVQLM